MCAVARTVGRQPDFHPPRLTTGILAVADMNRLTQAWERLLDSPGWRTFVYCTFSAVSGVLSGTFVAEITTTTGLDWSLSPKTYSLWALAITTGAQSIYARAVYKREASIEDFKDRAYCVAYMRSKCLPEAAEKYKEVIRSGNVGELEKVMSEVEKVLKP